MMSRLKIPAAGIRGYIPIEWIANVPAAVKLVRHQELRHARYALGELSGDGDHTFLVPMNVALWCLARALSQSFGLHIAG